MSLFFESGKERGKVKSTLLLYALMLSLVYVLVYIFAFWLSAGIIPEVEVASGFFALWTPPSLICIVASLVCAIPLFFVRDKRIVLIAFGALGVYALLLFVAIIAGIHDETRAAFLQLFVFYIFLPAFWGNVVCWGMQRLQRRIKSE
jgi:hypothetical protein